MRVLAGPQSTDVEREELAELAGIMGWVPASEHTFWPDVTVLYVTPDYSKCGVAVALVDVVADAFGITPTMIDI